MVIVSTALWINYGTRIEIIKPGVIEFSGPVNFENYETFTDLINTSAEPIKWVELESNGGIALAGILIGKAIHKHKLKVYVPKKCISSCANYLFPAGKKKMVGKNAVIVYHGGLQQENRLEKIINLFKQNNFIDPNRGKEGAIVKMTETEAKLQKKYFPGQKVCNRNKFSRENPEAAAKKCVQWGESIELEYFDLINIDSLTPYYGQRGSYKDKYQSYKYTGFYYDLKTLADLMNSKKIRIKGKKDWNPQKNSYVKNEEIYKVEL